MAVLEKVIIHLRRPRRVVSRIIVPRWTPLAPVALQTRRADTVIYASTVEYQALGLYMSVLVVLNRPVRARSTKSESETRAKNTYLGTKLTDPCL